MIDGRLAGVVPPRRRGLRHLSDATRYSFAGLARLWQEAAARLEVTGAALAALALALHGATVVQWFVFAGLCAAVLALEALNTALEILCDRVCPEWSAEIGQVKDLGSLAVGLGSWSPPAMSGWCSWARRRAGGSNRHGGAVCRPACGWLHSAHAAPGGGG